MKYRLIIAIVFIAFATMNISLFAVKANFQNINLKTQDKELTIIAKLAVNPKEQAQGLMYKKNLPEGEGMWFVYQQPEIPYFWMKNMLMSIDMIFVGEDLTIKHIVHSVPPCQKEAKCPTYSHHEPVKYVLEVPNGYAKKYNIQIGNQLTLN